MQRQWLITESMSTDQMHSLID